MKVGFCPNCSNTVVEIYRLDYNGKVTVQTLRREKARKILEKLSSEIIGEYYGKIKYGTKSNMGFRYGENVTSIKNGKEILKSYAVDFNGTKELLNDDYSLNI